MHILPCLIHFIKRFNRYMVECEYKNLSALDTWKLVLIDTWWNVNNYTSGSIYWGTTVLIDTWWNVNPKRWVF